MSRHERRIEDYGPDDDRRPELLESWDAHIDWGPSTAKDRAASAAADRLHHVIGRSLDVMEVPRLPWREGLLWQYFTRPANARAPVATLATTLQLDVTRTQELVDIIAANV